MTTLKLPTESARTSRTPRLRGIVAATAMVPLLALGACTSETPVTGTPSRTEAPAPGTGDTSGTAGTSGPSETGSSSSEQATTPAATQPTQIPVKVTLRDPVLDQTVTVKQVQRNMPFPSGYPVGAETFEIIGLYVSLQTGPRFSAELSPRNLTLKLGDSYVRPTTEFGPKYARPVSAAVRGGKSDGWLIYKIDKGTHPLVLLLHRPAYKVSTTDTAIPAKLFQATLTQ